ncbi:BA3454 family stress response protein [Oceanobacillus sp. Castelsardo]|nr:BA3454 family stress response protein [Oceanobacillus sp. Castelsardo]
MIQVNVTVDYEGQLYHTNVITNHYVTQDKILELALNQVKKQLSETEN